MRIIDEKSLEAVNAAIQQVERQTDAELVAVLARQADDYRYIPALWAALIALLVPGIAWLSGLWLDTPGLLLLQLAVFLVLAALLRVPFILFRLIPRSVRAWRAANLARRQFLENNLHHTAGESGVLIFISEAERYVEIIADRGINRHVQQEQWQDIVDALTTAIKQNNTHQGLLDCINACGGLLKEHVPATSEKNELPNHLVVI